MVIILHPWCYRFAIEEWQKRSNSDIKRMIEQGGVKVLRDENAPYSLNNTAVKLIPVNMTTNMTELKQGDIILFGGRKDLRRILLEVMSDIKFESMSFYKWIIDNKNRLYEEHI